MRRYRGDYKAQLQLFININFTIMTHIKKSTIPTKYKGIYTACYNYKLSGGKIQKIYLNREDIIQAIDLLIANDKGGIFFYAVIELLEKHFLKN